MKKIYGVLIVVIVLAMVGGYMVMTMVDGDSAGEKGVLVMQITDAPDDIENVFVTVSDVEVHRAVGDNIEENLSENEMPSSGWSTVVDNSMTYDLIAIQDVKAFLGSSELETGKYTQIRLEVEEASVVVNGEQESLKVPSESVKLISNFDIEENTETTLTLDFDVQESVHSRGPPGSGNYILRPTIQVIVE